MTPVLVAEHLTKTFGATIAVNDVSVVINRGTITALLGGNGAGKSTLTRIVSGRVMPDRGALLIDKAKVNFGSYSPSYSKDLGIRVVHQELSLCTNLTVSENVLLELGHSFRGIGWRGEAQRSIHRVLDEIFPQHRITGNSPVADLRLAERQMVEIARAALDPKLKLLILDEPTSSLDARRAHQLLSYLRRRASEDLAIVFIGHRLEEILDLAQECIVMRDGRVVWQGLRAETDEQHLITLLSAVPDAAIQESPQIGATNLNGRNQRSVLRPPEYKQALETPQKYRLEIGERWISSNSSRPIRLCPGEIVGLAGLEGSGQQRLLRAIYRASARPFQSVRRLGSAAYVTGDRVKEGIFGLWSTLLNITVSRQAERPPWALVSLREDRSWAEPWLKRFAFSPAAAEKSITDLSGGNQQKALLSRALLVDAQTILLDDPTRGVDVGVKAEFYRTLTETAERGKLIMWQSSEDGEFAECSRVLVFRRGRIVAEFEKPDREQLIAAAFGAESSERGIEKTKERAAAPHWLTPLAALLAVLVVIGFLNPQAISPFGLGLLLGTAIPLVLVSLGQMFVVGRSEIDLGIGGFAGLTNVISATWLVEKPMLGVLALLAGLLGYGLLGWLIHVRRIPAIVATLGSSFVWIGLGYALQPMPGGSAPDWLVRFFNLNFPVVPFPVVFIAACALVGILLLRTRFGIVLRGFGNNAGAMRELGWSDVRFHVWTYLTSGCFGLAAGLCLTGINTASDVNAAASYTLLSVAAVVMGGCDLVGGRIDPVGVVLAALTLSLLGALLGFLQVSSDYIAAVQGLILLGIVVIRTAWRSAR
jgi:ribose transport system ATP-binding protein